MPAAAVIPAPIAYIKVVAVKKLVVGLVLIMFLWEILKATLINIFGIWSRMTFSCRFSSSPSFTVKKLECLKQVL